MKVNHSLLAYIALWLIVFITFTYYTNFLKEVFTIRKNNKEKGHSVKSFEHEEKQMEPRNERFMKQELVVFDVCNTLYDSNTTFEFILFVLQLKRPGKLMTYKLLTKRYSPVFISWTAVGKITGQDIVRNKVLSLMRGLKKEELYELADDFYKNYLIHKKFEDVHQLLYDKSQNDDVWLFSNSIDPIIDTIAKNLGCKYESSRLQYDDKGIFTGRIQQDLSGKKEKIFFERFGKEAIMKMMCSDNKSDYKILSHAKKKIVVAYKPIDKQFWHPLNPEFIEKF